MQSFEVQFKTKKQIQTINGLLDYVDIRPDVDTSFTPILLASGWSETLPLLKKTIYEINKKGRRVIALDYTNLKYRENLSKIFPASGYAKANAFLAILVKEGINKIDIVGHSEGAINASIAVYLQPEYFNKLILVAPGGVMKHDTFPYLAWRFTKNLFSGLLFEEKKEELKYMKEVFFYFLFNPVKTLKEAISISTFNINDTLKQIQKNGVDIGIIQGEDDIIFPAENVENFIREVQVKSFRLVSGGHNDIHGKPDKFVDILVQALEYSSVTNNK